MTAPVLSVVVQTCLVRRGMADKLVEQLRKEAAGVEGVEVLGAAVDMEMAGPWASARKAWAMAEGDHHLVLQEDALLCRGFLDVAKMLFGMRMDRALSFYLATGATLEAQKAGKHWVECKKILTGLAVAMPREMVQAFLRWVDANEASHPSWGKHDDSRLQDFYEAHGVRVLVPAPCLVQHDLTVRSTMGTGPKVGRNRREARWWIGDGSPFQIDWSLGFEEPVRG